MAVTIREPAALAIAPLLRVEALSVRYEAFHALDGIDLDIRRGETVAFAGENGAGKSTLVRCIGGDMPAPLSPTNATVSPRRISRSMASRAWNASKRTLSASTRRSGSIARAPGSPIMTATGTLCCM